MRFFEIRFFAFAQTHQDDDEPKLMGNAHTVSWNGVDRTVNPTVAAIKAATKLRRARLMSKIQRQKKEQNTTTIETDVETESKKGHVKKREESRDHDRSSAQSETTPQKQTPSVRVFEVQATPIPNTTPSTSQNATKANESELSRTFLKVCKEHYLLYGHHVIFFRKVHLVQIMVTGLRGR